MSIFQEELRNDYGYENVVIIAVGKSNISNFNSNFTANSDLPLVMDQYPELPIRDQFYPLGQHKQIVILDYNGNLIGDLILSFSNLSASEKNYITDIIEANYEQSVLGDINDDSIVNIQDIILLVNMILTGQTDDVADINSDGTVNVLDIIQLVNMILS